MGHGRRGRARSRLVDCVPHRDVCRKTRPLGGQRPSCGGLARRVHLSGWRVARVRSEEVANRRGRLELPRRWRLTHGELFTPYTKKSPIDGGAWSSHAVGVSRMASYHALREEVANRRAPAGAPAPAPRPRRARAPSYRAPPDSPLLHRCRSLPPPAQGKGDPRPAHPAWPATSSRSPPPSRPTTDTDPPAARSPNTPPKPHGTTHEERAIAAVPRSRRSRPARPWAARPPRSPRAQGGRSRRTRRRRH
jgi:hypothetical protein